MNFSKLIFLAVLATVTTFYSCDDDDMQLTTSDVSFEFDYTFDGEALNYGQTYDVNGTKASFDIIHFYVGGIEFHPEEGDPITVDDKYLLVKNSSGAQDVTTLDKKHYHMTKFFVGVAPEQNNQTTEDFDSRPTDDPLARQTDVQMHWNWNAGYRFVRIDGMVDLDGDDVPETPMEYHLGTNNFLTELALELHTDIDSDKQTITFDFDVNKLFTDLDLSQDYSMHTGDAPEAAAKFAANISSAISKK